MGIEDTAVPSAGIAVGGVALWLSACGAASQALDKATYGRSAAVPVPALSPPTGRSSTRETGALAYTTPVVEGPGG